MKKLKIINYSISIAIIIFCIIGFKFAPNDPNHTDVMKHFLSPCLKYPFGTDELGRCVFSRILFGGQTTLKIVLIGDIIVIIAGTIIGILISNYNKSHNVLTESILNAVTAIPPIAYLIIFIGIWGNSIPTMLIALTSSLILRMIKLVKVETELEYEKAYILCAIASGASKMRVKLVHILPNIIRDIIQFICLSSGEMILTISGFSFIGITLGDDIIDWGTMLSDARGLIGMRPDIIFYPILFIFIVSFSFNYLGRQLRREDN